MPSTWTEQELDHLRTHYPKAGVDACTPHIARSPRAIVNKAHRLGLTGPRHWTAKELRYVTRNYATRGAQHCAQRLKRSVNGVRAKARQHLLSPGVPEGYTSLAILNPQRSGRRREHLMREAEREGVLTRFATTRNAPWLVPDTWADAFLERERERHTNDRHARSALYTLPQAAQRLGTSASTLKRALAGNTRNERLTRILRGVPIHRGSRNRILLAATPLERNLEHHHEHARAA